MLLSFFCKPIFWSTFSNDSAPTNTDDFDSEENSFFSASSCFFVQNKSEITDFLRLHPTCFHNILPALVEASLVVALISPVLTILFVLKKTSKEGMFMINEPISLAKLSIKVRAPILIELCVSTFYF